jgi:hypothetical protein
MKCGSLSAALFNILRFLELFLDMPSPFDYFTVTLKEAFFSRCL